VHPHPDAAMSDGPQSVTPDQFDDLMKRVAAITAVVGRKLN
jgi:3-deoxy-7-phosphoheptulonate synthase